MQPSTASQLSQPPPTAFVRRVSDLADPKLIGALRRAGGIGLGGAVRRDVTEDARG